MESFWLKVLLYIISHGVDESVKRECVHPPRDPENG